MDRLQLSKLPKEIIIEILLKVNEYEIYKIIIKMDDFIYGEFYIKCRSENEINEIMTKSDNIKSAIISLWRNYIFIDMTILINTVNDDIIFWNYHCSGSVRLEKGWEEIRIDQFDSIASRLFPQMLQAWMDTGLDGIFIMKLNIISYFI